MKSKTLNSIKNASDFECVCDDLLNDFMDSLSLDSPYIREPSEDEIDDFGECVVSFMFTGKGINLMDRYIFRLQKLGEKLFPEDDIEVQCSGIIQP